MLSILNVAILGSLIKLLIEIERPLVPASLYGVYALLLGGLTGASGGVVLLSAAVSFLFVFAWFWLLTRVEFATGPWWLFVVAGVAVGFMLGLI